jgi:hypothetical protein
MMLLLGRHWLPKLLAGQDTATAAAAAGPVKVLEEVCHSSGELDAERPRPEVAEVLMVLSIRWLWCMPVPAGKVEESARTEQQ